MLKALIVSLALLVLGNKNCSNHREFKIDIELVRREPDSPTNDNYGRVICYQAVVEKVRAMTSDSKIKLVETLAERIADACYGDYPDLTSLNVKIGKPDIFTDVSMVRVELERIFNKEVS